MELRNGIVFGGQDPESLEAINVAIASELFACIAQATLEEKDVHNGNAYQANGLRAIDGNPELVDNWMFFETNVQGIIPIKKFDHHNPGDFGYDKGAEEYFKASSLGQLMDELNIEPNEHQLYIAAADHCPADAYQGKCEGIDTVKFEQMRLEGKAEFYKTIPAFAYKANLEQLKKIMDETVLVLDSAETVNGIKDLRHLGMLDELPETALKTGYAYMTSIPDTDKDRKPTGNTKILIGGCTTPEMVQEFMQWGESLDNKITVYGNPTRGYAGVVVKGV